MQDYAIDEALRLALKLGWAIIPSRDRAPCSVEWGDIQPGKPPSLETVQEWAARFNPNAWQIITGRRSGYYVIDFDPPTGPALLQRLGLLPHVRSRSGGFHYYVRLEPNEEVKTKGKNSKTLLAAGFPDMEIKADKGALVHFIGTSEGRPYRWLRPMEPQEFETTAALPAALRDLIQRPPVIHSPQLTTPPPEAGERVDWDWLLNRALAKAVPEGRNNTGSWLTQQLRDADYTQAEATYYVAGLYQPTVQTAAPGKDPYTRAEALATVKSIYSRAKRPPIIRGFNRIERQTMKPAPQKATPKDSDFKAKVKEFIQPEPEPEPEPIPGPDDPNTPGYRRQDTADYHLTDLGNAERILHRNRSNVRYSKTVDRWFIWDGKRMEQDETNRARNVAQRTARQLWPEIGRRKETDSEEKHKLRVKHAEKSESHRSISGMIGELTALPGIPVKIEQLDARPMLFNCDNCTLDLSGPVPKPRPHNRADLLTRLAPVTYDPAAPPPLHWLKFLDLILQGSAPLIEFVQVAIGYCLTGSVTERALFLCWGKGSNGKSTFLMTIQELLGTEYAYKVPPELFVNRKPGKINNDIARIRGTRFVYASEIPKGARLNESLVKEYTGGEPLVGEFKYAEQFEFVPQCKFWLSANDRPVVTGTDEGIWDRIKLIPFLCRIPDVVPIDQQITRDAALALFRAELSGILNWALAGLAKYRAMGKLPMPEEVAAAVASYREEMDSLGDFLDEYTAPAPRRTDIVSATTLYKCYTAHCIENGETAYPQKKFGTLLTERGLVRKKIKPHWYYCFLRLIKDPPKSNSLLEPDRTGSDPTLEEVEHAFSSGEDFSKTPVRSGSIRFQPEKPDTSEKTPEPGVNPIKTGPSPNGKHPPAVSVPADDEGEV